MREAPIVTREAIPKEEFECGPPARYDLRTYGRWSIDPDLVDKWYHDTSLDNEAFLRCIHDELARVGLEPRKEYHGWLYGYGSEENKEDG